MQGFVHLVLLALLFITSVSSQRTSTSIATPTGTPNTGAGNASPSAETSASGTPTTSTPGSKATQTTGTPTTSTPGSEATQTTGTPTTSTPGSKATQTTGTPTTSTPGSKATQTTGTPTTSTPGSEATQTTGTPTTSTPGSKATQTTGTPTTSTPGSKATQTTGTPTTSTPGSPITPNTGGSTSTTARDSTTTGAVVSTPTGQYDPCENNNCTGASSCVGLNTTFFCMCREGYYYNQTECQEGKVFPGTFTMKASDIPDLEEKGSMAYQDLHFKITDFFAEVLKDPDYGQTVIEKVSPSISPRYGRQAADTVDVTVVNIFRKSTTLMVKDVNERIMKAVNVSTVFISYDAQDMCDYYGCVKNDNNCTDHLTCVCKSGMYRPNPQASRCVPDPCPQSCTSKSNKHCQWNATAGLANCVCLPDYMEDENKICQKCAFGYSGVNCQDNLQLILTIVGSIAGVCILILVIAVIFMGVRSKSREKESEEQKLVENNFQSMTLEQTELSSSGVDGSLSPKAHTTPSSQPHNPYNSFSSFRSFPRPDY